MICGPIKDIAWSSNNQRIVVVGEGREKFGHDFLVETGTSNGDNSGQTRSVNSYDFKPSRNTENELLFVSLSGYINYVDLKKPGATVSVISGHRKPITSLEVVGNEIYTTDSEGRVIQWNAAKVNCVSWSPKEKLIASGELDTAIIIWSVENPSKHLIIRSAHLQSQINGIKWLNESSLVSIGQDSNVKIWDIDLAGALLGADLGRVESRLLYEIDLKIISFPLETKVTKIFHFKTLDYHFPSNHSFPTLFPLLN